MARRILLRVGSPVCASEARPGRRPVCRGRTRLRGHRPRHPQPVRPLPGLPQPGPWESRRESRGAAQAAGRARGPPGAQKSWARLLAAQASGGETMPRPRARENRQRSVVAALAPVDAPGASRRDHWRDITAPAALRIPPRHVAPKATAGAALLCARHGRAAAALSSPPRGGSSGPRRFLLGCRLLCDVCPWEKKERGGRGRHTRAHAHTHAHAWTHMHAHVHMHAHTCKRTRVHTCTRMHRRTPTRACTCTHTHTQRRLTRVPSGVWQPRTRWQGETSQTSRPPLGPARPATRPRPHALALRLAAALAAEGRRRETRFSSGAGRPAGGSVW